jgi:hypothetical protein
MLAQKWAGIFFISEIWESNNQIIPNLSSVAAKMLSLFVERKEVERTDKDFKDHYCPGLGISEGGIGGMVKGSLAGWISGSCLGQICGSGSGVGLVSGSFAGQGTSPGFFGLEYVGCPMSLIFYGFVLLYC